MSAPRLLAPTTISGGVPTAGAGTLNTIALWTPDGNTLGNSLLTQSGNIVTNASGAIRAAGTTQTSPAFTRHDTTTSGIYFPATNEIGFTISNQHAMFISSGRLVGIGTTSPASALHVRNNTAGITLDSTLGGGRQYQLNPLRTGVNNAGFEIRDVTAGAAVISFDATQQVGIGTASPGTRLHVLASAAPIATLASSQATQGYLQLNYNTSTTFGYIGNGASVIGGGAAGDLGLRSDTGVISFATGGNTERARIDSTGRWYVGVGAVSPASSGIWAIINQPGGAGGQEWHNSTGSQGGAAIVPSQDRATWYVYSGSVGLENYKQSCAFTPTGIDLTGASATPGIKLPATPGNTDPNTLDCYADGGTVNSGGVTWTPALRFGGATTGIAGSQVGRYTRIGNMVFAQGTIALSSKGSATGAASIAGLPTSANVAATIYYSIAIGYNSKVTFTGQLHGLISVNSGIVELYQTSTAGVVSAITNTDFAADSVLTFTVCYPVT